MHNSKFKYTQKQIKTITYKYSQKCEMHINKRLNKKEHNIDKFYKNISSGKSFQKKIHSHGKLAEQRGGVNFGNGTLAGENTA